MTPSVGRIVHVASNGRCVAAIITDVHADGSVSLAVFPPFGPNRDTVLRMDHVHEQASSGAPFGGTWHVPDLRVATEYRPLVAVDDPCIQRVE